MNRGEERETDSVYTSVFGFSRHMKKVLFTRTSLSRALLVGNKAGYFKTLPVGLIVNCPSSNRPHAPGNTIVTL